MLTDTHCHLYFKDLKTDLPQVLKRASNLGVDRFICVGTNMDDSKECQTISEKYKDIYFSAGVHPHDSKDAPADYLEQIRDFSVSEKMVAVGEMGLDYFRNISPPEIQKKVFKEQMSLAQELGKPVVFHNRDADEDVIEILSEFQSVVGVAHCFSSNLDTAKALLSMGYYISFSGNLTFKNSHLPDIASEIPRDKVLVETDSPLLSPVPFRGKPIEPGRTRFVAEKLGEIHGLELEKIAAQTSKNADALFNFNST